MIIVIIFLLFSSLFVSYRQYYNYILIIGIYNILFNYFSRVAL